MIVVKSGWPIDILWPRTTTTYYSSELITSFVQCRGLNFVQQQIVDEWQVSITSTDGRRSLLNIWFMAFGVDVPMQFSSESRVAVFVWRVPRSLILSLGHS